MRHYVCRLVLYCVGQSLKSTIRDSIFKENIKCEIHPYYTVTYLKIFDNDTNFIIFIFCTIEEKYKWNTGAYETNFSYVRLWIHKRKPEQRSLCYDRVDGVSCF